jgi:hypothetical protein
MGNQFNTVYVSAISWAFGKMSQGIFVSRNRPVSAVAILTADSISSIISLAAASVWQAISVRVSLSIRRIKSSFHSAHPETAFFKPYCVNTYGGVGRKISRNSGPWNHTSRFYSLLVLVRSLNAVSPSNLNLMAQHGRRTNRRSMPAPLLFLEAGNTGKK